MEWTYKRHATLAGYWATAVQGDVTLRVMRFDDRRPSQYFKRVSDGPWITILPDRTAAVPMKLDRRTSGQAPAFVIEPVPEPIAERGARWSWLTPKGKDGSHRYEAASNTKRPAAAKIAADKGQAGNNSAAGNA
jgi:hypothetical protein